MKHLSLTHGAEKGLNEFLLLVVQVLAYAFGHRHGRAFEFQYPQGNAVDVQHHIGPLDGGFGGVQQVRAIDGDFFGYTEVVGLRVVPVDQPNGDVVLSGTWLHFDAVAQHFIHRAIAIVQAFAGVTNHLGEFVQGAVDEGVGDATGLGGFFDLADCTAHHLTPLFSYCAPKSSSVSLSSNAVLNQ